MRKYYILVSALLTTTLVGCGHQHTFSEATCEQPAICAECGETQGEPLGHDYSEAACETPATCSRCGEEDGTALGHDFSEATCEAPATCTRCGETEGEALEHDFAPATLDVPKTCKVCGLTEGEKVSVKVIDTSLKDVIILDEDRFLNIEDWDFTIYDADKNVIKRFEPDMPNRLTHSVADNYIVTMGDTSKGVRVTIYDKDGEIVCSDDILKSDYSLVPDFYEDWTYARCVGKDDIEIYNAKSGHILCEILPDKGDFFVTKEGIEVTILDEKKEPEFQHEGMEIYEYTEAIDGFLVNFIDSDEWGFVDADGNEIARYLDACSYNSAGYAMATSDRKFYSIIDSQQNIIAENIIEGKNSAIVSNGGLNRYLKITKPDDTLTFLLIE